MAPHLAEMPITPRPSHRRVLGMRVDAIDYDSAVKQVCHWARERESKFVCVAPVHMVMECYDSPEFRNLVNSADMVTPDGMPVVWSLRAQGIRNASRVYGPDLMRKLLAAAEATGLKIGLYGGSPRVLDLLIAHIQATHPALRIAYACAPPFRTLSRDEDDQVVKDISSTGVDILFVGLGCPKQERWMSEHRGVIDAPMLGVGAAFDFLAGVKPQAPGWMQRNGLEWVFRLITEPRRLWKRYAVHNPRFAALITMQLTGCKRFDSLSSSRN